MHINTFYIGCEDNGQRADNTNNILRFNKKDCYAHKPLIDTLSKYFCDAQILYEDKIITNPYKLAIYVEEHIYKEKKKHNPNSKTTILDGLYFWIKSMHEPAGGIIISIYATPTIKYGIKSTYDFRHTWPFKKEMHWLGDGEYITLHDTEAKTNPVFAQEYMSSDDAKLQMKTIDDIDNISKYPVKRISYSMKEEEIFTLLKHTKYHFSYPGGTYYSAGLINCPTIGLYMDKKKIDVYNYNQNKNINIEFTQNERMSRLATTGQYTFDFNKNGIALDHLTYLKHVTNFELVWHLKGYAEE
jgi:hypothetical protein